MTSEPVAFLLLFAPMIIFGVIGGYYNNFAIGIMGIVIGITLGKLYASGI